jgi:DNA-directed RNA polymerase beta subunit
MSSRYVALTHVPYYTNKGTIILDGSQYNLAIQIRLRPGDFTRLAEDGELDSHVDVMPGQGVSHDIHLDPESGVFKLHVSRESYPPLLPRGDARRGKSSSGDIGPSGGLAY